MGKLWWGRRQRVRIELVNGLGLGEVVTLVPGETVRLSLTVTNNVCDRGLGSEDGEHRLVVRSQEIPFKVRLVV